jgi:hypothetical protein
MIQGVHIQLVSFVCTAILMITGASAKNHNILPEINKQKQILNDTNVAAVYPVLYTNLMSPDGNNLSLTDGVATAFDNSFSASVDANDAMKLWNFGENIAEMRNDTALAIEFRPVPKAKDTIFYRLYLRQQPYTLKLFTQNFTGLLPIQAWLVDNYLNTRTAISLYDTTLYNFIPNSDTNSYRNRFMLVLNRQLEATPAVVTRSVNQNDPNITGVANNSTAPSQGSVNIYPNPTGNGNAMLRFNNMPKDRYTISVYSVKGQQVINFTIQHSSGSAAYPLSVNTLWPDGVYIIHIAGNASRSLIKLQMEIRK